MKNYLFAVKEHEEYGELGFTPKWYPNGDPLRGVAVAHDILEHFPGDDGRAEGELLALGAGLYIRGDGGYWSGRAFGNASDVENIAADFPEIWGHHVHRDGRTSMKPCRPARDQDLMDRCREIVTHAMKNLRDTRARTLPDTETRERMACWLSWGYRRAQRRYHGIPLHRLSYDLFTKIEQEADRLLKGACEGQILTVRVDLRNVRVRIHLDDPEEEW